MNCSIKSDGFILTGCSYATLNFVYDISSWSTLWFDCSEECSDDCSDDCPDTNVDFLCHIFFKKWAIPAPFPLFSTFQTNTTIFTTNKCPSSTWCWDSNSQPLEYESPAITTRPWLPSFICHIFPISFISVLPFLLSSLSINTRSRQS